MRAPSFYRNRSNRKVLKLIAGIRDQAKRLEPLSSAQFRDAFESLRLRASSTSKVSHWSILAPAFAFATESLRRVTGKVYYDVQLWGGIELARGAITEIQTGEGKTLVTALPAVAHALSGRGVHVATTNAYLSRRDFEELRPIYRLLGLSVGHVTPDMQPSQKRSAYNCDITYGPGYEFGFDYLRDQIEHRRCQDLPLGLQYLQTMRAPSRDKARPIQRRAAFAIIDEVDSVLIDEANTPLVLSSPTNAPQTCPSIYQYSHDVAGRLNQDTEYTIHVADARVTLSNEGIASVQSAYEVRPTGKLARSFRTMIEQALHAKHILRRDVHYVVRDAAVQIVDPHTGRIHDERRWRSGLHQAVEVKEGLTPSDENETDARITRQRFCNAYESICGLTGTAAGNETDFARFYAKSVVAIAPNRPCLRKRMPDRFFGCDRDKLAFVVSETRRRTSHSQPVLIATRSIEASHVLANVLDEAGLTAWVLNGLQDADEAEIVARAGEPCRITIATNMAGRGTDIHLSEGARDAGGLHVIATEFQESARIDRQLAGRAARQGDPGSCQFLAAPDDTLFTHHSPVIARRLTDITDPSGICSPSISARVQRLQKLIEKNRFESRCQMVSRDDWLETMQSSLARRSALGA